jgi:hypothetical protein
MKKILLVIILGLHICLVHAQRFFYLETDNTTSNLLKDGLMKTSQFVTKSPLGSDYIIKAEAGLQSDPNKLSLNIILQDSITLQTIYQTNEEYAFGYINKNAKLLLRSTIAAFIERNINQIILSAKDDHYDSRMKPLKPKKDKT